MLTLVSKDSVKISDHFDVLCVLIACTVLEIINPNVQKSKIQSYSVEHCTQWHTSRDNFYQAFSALFVLQATIAVVEDWERG